ncbi:MAG: hypothetical protein AB7H93_15625 [Vicinamibacterales bacterium]
MTRIAVPALAALLSVPSSIAAAPPPTADLRVTQRALVVQCVNGAAVGARERRWRLPPAPVTLAVTMRNDPRPGIVAADAGTAVIGFTPVAGHRYELEVRSAPTRFAVRVWPKGEWTPVVRDRTTDTIVSGPPEWADARPCAAPR